MNNGNPMQVPAIPRAHERESLEGGRVLLLGGYGLGNVGDEAILAGMLRQHDLWDATVVSYDPEGTRELHGVEAVSPFGPALPRAFIRARRVVIGGGGIFSSYMGPFARAIPEFALFAHSLGKKVEFRAFGAYEGTPRLTARALAWAVARADHVSVRDASSAAFLRSLGVDRPIHVVPDPALALDPSPPERVRTLLRGRVPGLRSRFVVLGVRRLRDPADSRRLAAALAGLGTALADDDVDLLFVPFCRHPYAPLEDDESFARELSAHIGAGRVLAGTHHPSDLLGVVRMAACVVPVRFHALVFALRMARPTVAVPYDTKCDDLLAESGAFGLEPQTLTGRRLTAAVRTALSAEPTPLVAAHLMAQDSGLEAHG